MASQAMNIEILGRAFTVACSDEEREGLLHAVAYLDEKMRDIRDTGKIVAIERIAIMAALNITHEFLNTQSDGIQVGEIKRRIGNIEDQIDEALSVQNKLL